VPLHVRRHLALTTRRDAVETVLINGKGSTALRVASAGRLRRRLQVAGMPGHHGYGTASLHVSADVLRFPVVLRPSIAYGFATRETPPDEWHGLGGPESFGGLRRDEWLGRRRFGAELRAFATLRGVLGVQAALQAGRVDDAIGRADLAGRLRLAGVVGARLDVPLGPLQLDWGMAEGGQSRWDVRFGESF